MTDSAQRPPSGSPRDDAGPEPKAPQGGVTDATGAGSAEPYEFRQAQAARILAAGGLVCSVLGLTVLGAWLLGVSRVTAVFSGFDPMPYNTALAFVLLGLSLVALAAGRSRIAAVSAGLAAGYGVLTIAQHVTGRSLFLDNLFFPLEPGTQGLTVRGSPNAGLSFLLTGIGVTLLALGRNFTSRLAAALLGATTFAIAAADLIGYLGAVDSHVGGWILPQMALHTAAGFALLGALQAYTGCHLQGGPRETGYARGAVLVSLLVALLSVLLAQLLRLQERKHIRQTAQVTAASLADQLQHNFESRALAVSALARLWQALPLGGWDTAATATLEASASRRGFGWIPSVGTPRWLALAPGEQGLVRDPWWPSADLLARASSAGQVAMSVGMSQGRYRLGILAQTATPAGRAGYLWLVSDLERVIDGELRSVVGRHGLAIRDGGVELYRRERGGANLERVWGSRAEMSSGPLRWEVAVWPTVASLGEARSTLPIVTLAGGMLVAVLLGLALALSRAAHQRAGEIEAAHLRLTTEIREREAAEAALTRSEEQLRQAQKMEAVGRLAGGIAHDYNNILTVIRGNARSLLLQDLLPGLARDALEHIDRAAARGGLLTSRLLAFSQRQLLQPERLEVGELAAGQRDNLAQLLGPHVQLVVERQDGPDLVEVDRRWLSQVILDLGFNAREAMPLGGTLWIRTRPATDELRRLYGVKHVTGPAVVLEIEDSGRGMDEATRGRLFEPFFSTKKFGQGAGLALASAYGIVRQSGGEIGVDSIPERGTRIGIFLPTVPGSAEPQSQPALRGATVLVAEDEAGILRLMRRVLEAAGCRVIAGATAEEALEQLDQSGATPDLLVSDIVMPGMSGIELADRLRSRRPGLGVLLVSAYTSDALKERGIEALGAYLLQKPFTAEELLEQVARTLVQRSAGTPAQ